MTTIGVGLLMFSWIRLKNFFVLFISSVCIHSYASEMITLKVGLMSPDRPPYFFVGEEGGTPTGLYIDILETITENMPINLEYYFLPQARIRMYMETGKLDLEPGVDISWRELPSEVSQSIYTIPFMESNEVYAYIGIKHKKLDFNKSEICAINGFDLPEDFNQSNIHLVNTEKQLYSLIIKKRCDIAIAPVDVINYWNRNSPEKIKFTTIVDSYQLRFRLNIKHKDLINRLNSNIETLQRSGNLKSIRQRYIN